MNHPCALSLFLADGNADGLKILEKSNWNGCGLACPKNILFERHRKRVEFSKPGVYLLRGESDEGLGSRLYIGEADPVMPRLETHFKTKEWWSDVIVFTTNDQTLNKAFIQHLEAKLIQLAIKTERFIIENGNSPLAPSLSERELAICEGFLREMLLCLPLLGVNLEPANQPVLNDELLYIRSKGLEARGIEATNGFVVLAGSHVAVHETESIPPSVSQLRVSLLEQGIIHNNGNNMQLIKDHRFGSPSTASAVILGSSSNGRDAWKNNSGECLKSIQNRKYGLK